MARRAGDAGEHYRLGRGRAWEPAAAKAVLVAIVLGGTTEGGQGWEWDNWPIDARQMAEGAVGDALIARELLDHSR